ncbi:telomere repeat-binding protein 5-like isoform X2 [Benincasa hispida]|uniref:telomere repeat-binding protein 5-like isoform X2 n=1 Tax=Benincasa hispida TaxID=102211 RepID=UPI00190219FE|nr:telomere repeat-binding protein 5-like isoform X2 [Benincasa hispida]
MENPVHEVGFDSHIKSCGRSLDGGYETMVEDKSEKVMSGVDIAASRSLDPVVCGWNPQMWIGSEKGFKVPPCKDHGPQHPCPTSQEVVVRDDDNNSFGCIYPTTSRNSFRTSPCNKGHRIRKILASKNRKVAANYGAKKKPKAGGYKRKFNFNKRNPYKNQRSQMNIPFKKRKLFDGCLSDCNGRRMVDRISDSNASARESSAHGKSSLVAGNQGDSRVKLRIKSFRVPELFIEIPETATVSSLKRTVMEAVGTIIGHGIHVGVILRGKKVRDDNKTLIQTGISCDNQDGCLGFTLEPHSSQTCSSFCHGQPPSSLPCSSTLETINGCPPKPTVNYSGNNSTLLLETHAAKASNSTESVREPVPFLADTRVEERSSDSKSLVTVPAMAVDAPTVVPICQKSHQFEVGHRRMRRPFSVDEVEALVHAVETLGPGRWRDVKLRAFDNVKHRTYVDLKDKWKTLVHTAKISPHQRRGEQVPQQLLDRVLTALAYWSQQHQQIKHHPPKTCLLQQNLPTTKSM